MKRLKDKSKPEHKHSSRPQSVRASHTNAELWRRRAEVYRLWSAGIPRSEIAERYFITVETVGNDIHAFADIENPLDVKIKIDAGYKEIIRRAFDRAETTRPEFQASLLRVAVEALTRLALLHSLIKPDTQNFNFTNTNILNAGPNRYDKLDDNGLEKEFTRRRLAIRPSITEKSA